eukprot:5006356-Pleurochrysis_carterae.AAC.1
MESQHGDELTCRARLHAPFPRLADDVLVAPLQLCRRRSQGRPVDLATAGELRVARRALYRDALVR